MLFRCETFVRLGAGLINGRAETVARGLAGQSVHRTIREKASGRAQLVIIGSTNRFGILRWNDSYRHARPDIRSLVAR